MGDIQVINTASGSVAVEDDGTEVVASASRLNFGTDLSVTDSGSGEVKIDSTASGGGSGAWTRLATVDLASAGLITFSSISASYRHLRIEARLRTVASATTDAFVMRVGNGTVDSGSNYAYLQRLSGSTSTVVQSASANLMRLGNIPGANAGAGFFAIVSIDVRDYGDTSINRLVKSESGARVSSSIYFESAANGHWANTADVIDIISLGGITDGFGNMAAGSRAELYGIN